MSELEAIYDRAFFAEYGESNEAYNDACDVIATEIVRRFTPTTAVDWGCGTGLHVAAMRRAGVNAIGIDGVLADDDLRANGVDIRVADITAPVAPESSFESYDLSLCIDVLEHLHDSESAPALANITRGASLVILSCAPPGQGGHHHVNERPRRYWVGRMADIGWKYDRRETGAMENVFIADRSRLPWSWMYHNLCVYRPMR